MGRTADMGKRVIKSPVFTVSMTTTSGHTKGAGVVSVNPQAALHAQNLTNA